MRWRLLAALLAVAALPAAGAPSDYEWSWADYAPTPPPRTVGATVAFEPAQVEAPGNEFLKSDGFFVPMARRAVADMSNLFERVLAAPDGSEAFRLRLSFRWDGRVHPAVAVVDPRDGTVLATMSRPSARRLRPVALDLQDAMRALKADLAERLDSLPVASPEPEPAHRDPI